MNDNILEVKDLKISFRTQGGTLKAVRNINFNLKRGETLAIVGESGSGKSVTSKAILGILSGNSIVEGGEIIYDGKDLLKIPEDEMHKIRGDKISMIFQDPLSSLDPIVKIGRQLTEAMLLKNKLNRKVGRNDFNSLLAILKNNTIAADASDAEEITTKCKTFDNFNINANKLAAFYNAAVARIIDCDGIIEDYLFRVEKKQKMPVAETVTAIVKKLDEIHNRYLTWGYDEKINELRKQLSSMKKVKDCADTNLLATLNAILDVLKKIQEEEEPNFFRIGFYLLDNKETDFDGMSNKEINELTLAYLNDHFMIRFIELAKKGISYSYNLSIEKKKVFVDSVAPYVEFFKANSFTKAEAKAKIKELEKLVEASINKLVVVKDSLAYTFSSSIEHALDRYFEAKIMNPKEEKRFARQTAKYEKMVASGKNVDWKVRPKVVYELSDLANDIAMIIQHLADKYQNDIDNSVNFNAETECIALIDHFKSLAAEAVFVLTKSMAKEKAIKLMEEVGISEARIRYNMYPFEFSGGMRQRIVIAIALAANPDILICDEPTTALDVTIQAQILDLINRLKKERNISVIFITHNLGVVANMADSIAVMYAGQIIEYGTSDEIFYDPRHPYTWALLSSMPDLDTKEKLESIPGTPPNLIYPPVGDAFAERNKYAMKIDFEEQPPMFDITETHKAATWLLHPDAPKVEPPTIITERIARMKAKGGANDG